MDSRRYARTQKGHDEITSQRKTLKGKLRTILFLVDPGKPADAIVDALGMRAFVFTLRLERCATRADLAALLPDYSQALTKKLDRNTVSALLDRTRELLGQPRR